MAEKKLLVADDSLTIQKVIRLALSNFGYDIQAVSDGRDAIEQISLFRPDVVLIDVSLSGKSAFDIKAEVNEMPDLSHVKFVLMSSAFEKIDEKRVKEVVFDGQLIKPFDPANLRTVLSDVLVKDGVETAPKTLPKRPTKSAPPVPPPSEENFRPKQTRHAPPPPPSFTMDEASEEPELQIQSPQTFELSESELEEVETSDEPLVASPMDTGSDDDESEGGEEDIRKLTESTIRMSGLGDFQWSVQDTAIKHRDLKTKSDGARELDDSSIRSLRKSEPELEPPTQFSSSEDITFPGLSESSYSTDTLDLETETNGVSSVHVSDSIAMSESQGVIPLSTDQMESLLSKQLGDTLERMARDLLPGIAEKIIKQEIHKLLSSPPPSELE